MPKPVTLQPNMRLVAVSRADIKAAQGEGKRPTFTTNAYNGDRMQPDWPLAPAWVVADLAGLRANEPIAALLDHDQQAIVGQSTGVRIDSSGVFVDGILTGDTKDKNDPSGKVALHASNGFVWKTSLGMKIERLEYVEEGESVVVNGKEFVGPIYIQRSGAIDEVSFLSVAADKEAVAKVAAKAAEGDKMDFHEWLKARDFDPANLTDKQRDALKKQFDTEVELKARSALAPTDTGNNGNGTGRVEAGAVDPNAELDIVLAPAKLKAARRAKIREITAREVESNPGTLSLIEATAHQAIAEDWTPDRYELTLLRGRSAGVHINNEPRGQHDPNADARVFEVALCRAGGLRDIDKHYDDRTIEACDRRFRHGIGLGELLLCAARANGFGGLSHRDVGPLLRAAFAPYEIRAAGGPSTFDLSGILSNVSNKLIRQYFMGIENVWRQVGAVGQVQDFKQRTTYSLTGDFQYKKLKPGGELEHGTAGEESYTNQADTFGRLFLIDRRDIVNDDLNAFMQILRRLGRGGALSVNHEFWTEFMDNSTFFTSARANFDDGADSALSIDGLKAAETLFLKLKDPDGKPLGIRPAILLTPPDLSRTGLELMQASGIVMTQDTIAGAGTVNIKPGVNTFQGNFLPLSSVYLSNTSYTGYSTTAWFLLANPADMPVIEIVFLNGKEIPTVDQADADFNRLGVQMRAYHDFGVNLQEYRGGVKMAGA